MQNIWGKSSQRVCKQTFHLTISNLHIYIQRMYMKIENMKIHAGRTHVTVGANWLTLFYFLSLQTTGQQTNCPAYKTCNSLSKVQQESRWPQFCKSLFWPNVAQQENSTGIFFCESQLTHNVFVLSVGLSLFLCQKPGLSPWQRLPLCYRAEREAIGPSLKRFGCYQFIWLI